MKLKIAHPSIPNTWEEVESVWIGRTGTMSPQSMYLKYRGRLVSPYEYKIRKIPYLEISQHLNLIMEHLYSGPKLAQLIYNDNPLLRIGA